MITYKAFENQQRAKAASPEHLCERAITVAKRIGRAEGIHALASVVEMALADTTVSDATREWVLSRVAVFLEVEGRQ